MPKTPIPHPKRRGEWAELVFMARAAAHDLTVSKPYGESSPFDFIVASGRRLSRVQVRSTASLRGRGYRTSFWHDSGGAHRPYTHREIDFLAMYVIPHDAWYIVPVRAIGPNRNILTLYPHLRPAPGRFEDYREAWALLR